MEQDLEIEKPFDAGQFMSDVLSRAFSPPSDLPGWRWCEENIILDNTGPMPGRYSTEFTPQVRWFMDASEQAGVETVTGQISAQSGKTQMVINMLVRIIAEDPGPCMWVAATKDNIEETAQKRIFPAIENCAVTAPMLPKEKKRRSKKLIQLDSMNLMMRGTESRVGLQSDPVRYIIGDERREWKKGAIDLLRKRTRTFYNAKEIGIGTAGNEDDELDSDFKKGTQTHFHFHCLKCQHSQPFRFGKAESAYFPKERTLGGLVWEENDLTRPNGDWGDYSEVRKTVRFECEKCGHHYQNSEKVTLIKTIHPVDYNLKAPKKFRSFTWNALAMVWPSCDWANIVEEFLRANEQMKQGNLEPLRAFITETLGEPFQKRGKKIQTKDLLERVGEYKAGEFWFNIAEPSQLEKNSGYILTFDRQLMRIVYVIRQWRPNGQSRFIEYGEKATEDDVRQMQIEMKIKSRCVFGDDHGPNTSKFRQKCLQWGWTPMFGEERKHFSVQKTEGGIDKSFWQGWATTELDPGIGTGSQGITTILALRWCNEWYKDKLYHFFIRGQGPLWEIPQDAPAQYLKELNANEWREKEVNGRRENYWHETGEDHAADCELEQIAAADYLGLTRSITKPKEEMK